MSDVEVESYGVVEFHGAAEKLMRELVDIRNVAAPTDDLQVKQRLRSLGEPAHLFGEDAADRRDRLKALLFELRKSSGDVDMGGELAEEGGDSDDDEFYVLGSEELLHVRQEVARSSILQSLKRLETERQTVKLPVYTRQRLLQNFYSEAQRFEPIASQVGDNRPLSQCKFSPDSQHLAVGSFSGRVQLWSVASPEPIMQEQWMAHLDSRISGLDWYPRRTDSNPLALATGALDGSLHLWSLDGGAKRVGTFEGHEQRVCRVKFHPHNELAATTSVDGTWRLFDVETQSEILLQEGHDEGVYGLAHHPDGSLLATGGLDGICRIWDLRSGKSIMLLQGHSASIYGLDFHPNGTSVCTGGGDHVAKVWDLRIVSCRYTLPAHANLISECKFLSLHALFPTVNQRRVFKPFKSCPLTESQIMKTVDGSVLLTSSFDGNCKLWTYGGFKLLATLTTNESRVLHSDMSSDGRCIATANYDKTFKLFAKDDSTS